jgi:hypothetical protein
MACITAYSSIPPALKYLSLSSVANMNVNQYFQLILHILKSKCADSRKAKNPSQIMNFIFRAIVVASNPVRDKSRNHFSLILADI